MEPILMVATLLALGASATAGAVDPPGAPDEIQVITDDGEKYSVRPLLHGRHWMSTSRVAVLLCPPISGRHLRFEREGPRVFVRVDGSPRRLAGIVAKSPEGIQALRQAMAAGARDFTVWLDADWLQALLELGAGRGLALSFRDPRLIEASPVAPLVGLRALDLSRCEKLKDLTPLAGMKALEELDLTALGQLSDLRPLSQLTALRSLSLTWCHEAGEDLSPLAALRELRWLELTSCFKVANLAPLAANTELEWLRLTYCKEIVDLRPLAALTRLRALFLGGCKKVTGLTPLANLTHLRFLELEDCTGVSDLTPLSKLTEMTQLNLHRCTNVTDLAPLREMKKLRILSLDMCEKVTDLAPLRTLTAIRSLSLAGCGATDVSPLEALIAAGADVSGDWAQERALEALAARVRRRGSRQTPGTPPAP